MGKGAGVVVLGVSRSGSGCGILGLSGRRYRDIFFTARGNLVIVCFLLFDICTVVSRGLQRSFASGLGI